MLPTREQAADAILRLGYEEPLDDVVPEVWLQLAAVGLVQGAEEGQRQFTERGWAVYTMMEGGDYGYIPELDDGQWADG
jgi:hypothetical protein